MAIEKNKFVLECQRTHTRLYAIAYLRNMLFQEGYYRRREFFPFRRSAERNSTVARLP